MTHDNRPAITLITIARNAADTIGQALESVARQGFRDFEYLVMDGASTDGTQGIIEPYVNGCVTYFQSKQDGGSYDATVQAAHMARGRIVGLLMADDWLEGDALQTLAALERQTPDTGIFGFSIQEHAEREGRLTPTQRFDWREGTAFSLEDGFYAQGLGKFYRRDVFLDYVKFDLAHYPYLADKDRYVRLGLASVKMTGTPKVLYHMRYHEGSITSTRDPARRVKFCLEMHAMGRYYLGSPGLLHGAVQRRQAADWLVRANVSLAAWRWRAGERKEALRTLFLSALSRPWNFLRVLCNHQVPPAYRGRPAQKENVS